MTPKWSYAAASPNSAAPSTVEANHQAVAAECRDERCARLIAASVNTIRLAAERLGLDPLGLAEALEDGELADLVFAAQGKVDGADGVLTLIANVRSVQLGEISAQDRLTEARLWSN